ncbi:hypothetical protein IHQ68_15190 [Chelatococcus sambhunathii]|uniref:Uncharacterized protein n=1 Tax=Chelatococcus sambhunathii TaxID=363953 RepID=A0ABU1DIL6_9HYPH|nr:hypothetical protein [Chelatococcus sambhunathii]MDR4307965.1 hypothetical protein [Chelatococcus sambhunathii]
MGATGGATMEEAGGLRKRVLAFAAVLALIVGGFVLARWASQPSLAPDKPVAQQWIEAVSQFGLEPVYPPQEDFVVGDILAFITADRKRYVEADPLPLRAVKLWNADLSAELKETYSATYRFPATSERPANEKSIWKQPARESASIFETPFERRDMPLALLPGFTIATKRAGDLDASGLSAVVGLRASGAKSVQVSVEGVETYGVPALYAEAALLKFCGNERFKNVCTDKGMRAQLSMIVGSDICEMMPAGPKGKTTPRFSVELGLVARVYLARSVQTFLEDGSSVTLSGSSTGQAALPSPPSPPAQLATPPDAAAESARKSEQTIIDEKLSAQRASITQREATTAPGVQSVVQRGDSSRIAINQVLQRPVAIGFRSVRYIARPVEGQLCDRK